MAKVRHPEPLNFQDTIGDSFVLWLAYRHEDGTPMDMTDSEWAAQVRYSTAEEEPAEFSMIVDASHREVGDVILTILPSDTARAVPGWEYAYDVERNGPPPGYIVTEPWGTLTFYRDTTNRVVP